MEAIGEPETRAGISIAEPQRTHPLGLLVNAIKGLGNAIIPLAAIAFSGDSWGLTGALAGLAMLAILAFVGFFSWLAWWRLTYTINPEDIRVESGILSRQARSVPYERIQDISLEQKLLARIFGLAEVKFETGAGGGDDLTLAFLTLPEGERLRELIRDRKEGEREAVAGETAAAPAEGEPIFAMSPARIFTFGLFEFSLVVFAVLIGVAQQFDFLIPWEMLPFDDFGNAIEERSRSAIETLDFLSLIVPLLSGLIGIIGVGIMTGVVRTTMREWGFRLDRTPKGFRRRRGLTTLTDVVLPAHRVQAAIVRTGWIRRIFGWYGLKFVSLAQDTSGSSSHDVAPFAKLSEIWPIAREAAIDEPGAGLEWHRPIVWRFMIEALILAAILSVIAALLTVLDIGFGWMPVALAALAVIFAAMSLVSWRRHSYALDARQLYAKRGFFAPRLTIGPRVKLQSAEIVTGPIGRIFGYADLHLGLAGGAFEIPGVPLAQAGAMRAAVVDSIARVDFSDLPQ